MFPLIETATAFAIVMLMLSFLVKSLVSVVKNHFEYYSENLEAEVKSLLQGIVDQASLEAVSPADPALGAASLDDARARVHDLSRRIREWLLSDKGTRSGIPWRALGEEYMTVENMGALLRSLGYDPATIPELQQLVALHRANLKYAFSLRMKNLSLVCGLALCLALNINAFSIWKTLYADAGLRAQFADTGKIDEVLGQYEVLEKMEADSITDESDNVTQATLRERRKELLDEIAGFQEEVSFGIGAVWHSRGENLKPYDVFLEFLGSVLTGIFVSIGAPYLHEFVRWMGNFRASTSAQELDDTK